MGNLIKLFLLLALAACAKNLPSELEKGIQVGGNKPVGEKTFIQGEFISTDENTITLTDQLTKPLVIIFSQDTCVICRAETKMLVETFKAKQNIPQNVDIYTVLVGTVLDDVIDFKDELSIPWLVGFQNSDTFFKDYCPGLKVPCVVVQTPTNGFVFQKTGEFKIQELEKFTGAWTY